MPASPRFVRTSLTALGGAVYFSLLACSGAEGPSLTPEQQTTNTASNTGQSTDVQDNHSGGTSAPGTTPSAASSPAAEPASSDAVSVNESPAVVELAPEVDENDETNDSVDEISVPGAVESEDATASSNGPCPTNGDPCKILPLGDSITDGFGVPGGYRIELFRQAVSAEKNITFIGGSANGPSEVDGAAFPQQHEGHTGWTIQQIDDIVPVPALNDTPHIILLHIGTNDMFLGPAGAAERLNELLDELTEAAPSALLIVSKIIPFPGAGAAVGAYNADVEQVVNRHLDAGSSIVLVDQFDGFPTEELADGVHPNQAGYQRMATIWFEALAPLLP